MSIFATVTAAGLVQRGKASHLILSAAYHTWRKESEFKMEIAQGLKIPMTSISIIPEVTDSYDEAKKIRELMKQIGTDTLVVVADKWHMPRAIKALKFYLPKINLESRPFTTLKYEITEEPSWIKSVRAGYAPLWIIWNLLFYILTPLFLTRKD